AETGPDPIPGRPGYAAPRPGRRDGRRMPGSALYLGLQPSAGRKPGNAPAGNRDPLARPRIDTLARAPLGDAELAEAREVDVIAAAQRVGDAVQHRLHGIGGLLLAADPCVAGQPIDELSLGQRSSSSSGAGEGG